MGRYVRRKKPASEKTKMWVIRRLTDQFGGQCYLCHEPFKSKGDITLDHLVPRSKGGTDDVENLRLAHFKCNQSKANLSLEEFAVLQEGF